MCSKTCDQDVRKPDRPAVPYSFENSGVTATLVLPPLPGHTLWLIPRARATASRRLTVDNWIQAGYTILAEEGMNALKIDRLCSHLEVAKGSFYWHFSDMPGYRGAHIEAWGELRDDDHRHFVALAGVPPRERLSRMMSSLVSARHWTPRDRRALSKPRGRSCNRPRSRSVWAHAKPGTDSTPVRRIRALFDERAQEDAFSTRPVRRSHWV